MNTALGKLPEPTVRAKCVLPASLGPPGTLYGVLLEDDSQVFVLGEIATDGAVTIKSVVFRDPEGNSLFQEFFGDGWALLYVPGGDGIHFDVTGSSPRITMLLNSTSPRSEIAMVVRSDGELVLDEEATKIVLIENPSYAPGNARARAGDSQLPVKADTWKSEWSDCTHVSNTLVWAVQLACDVKSQITSGIPVAAIEKTCIVANMAVDTVRAIRGASADSTEQRIMGGLKGSITALCELGKMAVGAANVITKFNPLDGACVALSLWDSGTTLHTGQSLADQICRYFASDEILPGVMTMKDRVNISVYEGKDEDGDMIAIRHDGQTVFSGVVTIAPRVIQANLHIGFNHFEFEALNEGTGPPNTARVLVQDHAGTSLGATSYNLTTGEIATLDIVRK